MLPKLAFLSLAAMAVHAAPAPSKMAVLRQDNASASAKLFIGGGPPGTISVADFDGKSFKVVTKNTIQGSSPSWLLFKEPNVLYAVDENTNTTRTFSYNPNTDALEPKFEATGSSGVVSLEFNKDRTRMLGAAYGQGQIDVWDTSDPAGSLKLLKQIPSEGPNGPDKSRQEGPHPHQVLLDPSGRYFLVNDLGKDTISVIDTADDKFNVVHRVNVKPAGAGPRHGAFYPPGQKQATHYFLACEMGNIINVYGLAYNVSAGGIAFALKQTVSTFGDNKNHTGAGAGEISVSADGKHLYVSNRLTGGKADNIAHFTIDTCQDEPLRFVKLISSGGGRPRMFSLSKDGKFMFAANQDPAIGLSALRIGQDGSLQENPVASMPLSAPDQGPMPPSLTALFAALSIQQQSRSASILASLADNPGAHQKRIRKGRGPSSGYGKTSGRGHKGQKQHGKVKPWFQGGQTPLIKVHGRKGFENFRAPDMSELNLDRLQAWIDAGRIDPAKPITPKEIVESGLIGRAKDGIKLLARGKDELRTPIDLIVSRASASAIEAVEKAGGKILTRYFTRQSIRRLLKGESITTRSPLPTGPEHVEEVLAEARKGPFMYRLPDPTSRWDIEYYRDPAHRGYLSHTLQPGESPSLYFKVPTERKLAAGKKEKAGAEQAEDDKLF